jgi:hypothetical protein
MTIQISDERSISGIQEEFNLAFPYLKLEFFRKPHKTGAPSLKKEMKPGDKTIRECRKLHQDGSLTIIPTMTVSELEQRFQEMYGLSVQVFRKSGRVWLETTVTDNWTLYEQNRQGEALSLEVNRP